ncbi:restriction endonuclease [Pseudomonas paeninsulae]|uniref:restriction endonuclease n=1 Tax=Pseudomonas paeninsulae TaxID=3110772 RepID=UPI002D767015|nr:restriction endonuclease [Pseudomonas sp. IT1137]
MTFLFALFAVALYICYDTNSYGVMALIIGFLVLALWGLVASAKKEEGKINHVIKPSITALIEKYVKVLALKQDQTVRTDAYSNCILNDWHKEIDYFINTVLMTDEIIAAYLSTTSTEPAMLNIIEDRLLVARLEIVSAVHRYQTEQLANASPDESHVEDLEPQEFESFCAKILRDNGWNARVTKASGDQGIDIIATLGGIKAVLQCKKYSKPVGNAAVQEVIAGKQFEQADVAIVVSNCGYTRSAIQLASMSGVHLIHYSELADLSSRIRAA